MEGPETGGPGLPRIQAICVARDEADIKVLPRGRTLTCSLRDRARARWRKRRKKQRRRRDGITRDLVGVRS